MDCGSRPTAVAHGTPCRRGIPDTSGRESVTPSILRTGDCTAQQPSVNTLGNRFRTTTTHRKRNISERSKQTFVGIAIVTMRTCRCRRSVRCCAILSLLAPTIVSSFSVSHGAFLTISAAFPAQKRKDRASPWAVFAKPKKTVVTDDSGSAAEIPANLRRKVNAKRPTLGHVVPESVKTRGGSANPRLRPQGKAREAGLNNPSMLRIAAGTAKGRRLDSPNVYLRPMMGKVREAVYSTFTAFGLYDPAITTRHLDIFAGSGSVGLESLSRGAAHCTFVDLSEDCCSAVERNVKWCDFAGKEQIVCGEAIQVLNEPFAAGIPELQTYQLVTLCPPYEEIVYGDLIEAVANSPVVTDDTVVLIEYPVELGCLPHVVSRRDGGAMVGVRNRRYGRTVIAIYVVNPTGRLEVAYSRPEEFITL